jgi:hypothetical protein
MLFAIVAVTAMLSMSACHRQTCPTYTQTESATKQVRV